MKSKLKVLEDDLDPLLENRRILLADKIASLAAYCRSNDELLDSLRTNTPIEKLGHGSTRTAYSLPLDLIMKLENPPLPEQLIWQDNWFMRGLTWASRMQDLSRMRQAMWREMALAIRFPNLLPRIYGVLFAFGEVAPNPALIIMEKVTPISTILGDDDADFRMEDMCICPQSGRLRIYDRRITDETHVPCSGCFVEVFPKLVEKVTDVSNVGLDSEGRLVLLDGGNYLTKGFQMVPDYFPNPSWWECYPRTDLDHRDETFSTSRVMMGLYCGARAVSQQPRP